MNTPVTPPEATCYAPLLRPASFATLPRGIVWDYVEAPWDLAHLRPELPRSAHRHGVIAVSRPLTADECEQFDLQCLGRKPAPASLTGNSEDATVIARARTAEGRSDQPAANAGLRDERREETFPAHVCGTPDAMCDTDCVERAYRGIDTAEKLDVLEVQDSESAREP